ncbi:MAG: fibrobacter succinogenes major paralogous domain-containing protein [Muribaculaceae bacterium]|nr:fibrobacter succinogenes major paralogous domain-containing protein [Muribaculaceae bacterium]
MPFKTRQKQPKSNRIHGTLGILLIGLIAVSAFLTGCKHTDTKQTYTKQPTKTSGPLTGSTNGHDWVDLGLPSGIKWATKNVGATNPEENGDYFSWGETEPKIVYADTNCITYPKDFSSMLRERIVDADGNLTKEHDAASINWGKEWRTPTDDEFKELVENCKWEFTELNGATGFQATGPNGKSIFIIAAGYRLGAPPYQMGEYGFGDYWSATAVKELNRVSCCFGYSPKTYGRRCYARYRGRTIRPVTN